MKIRTEHRNLGAALMQIAEHDSFTAINPLRTKAGKVNNAFLINDDTCLFLKYGNEPRSTGDYQFTFTTAQLDSIRDAHSRYDKIFVGLVCVEDQEICCIDYEQLETIIQARRHTAGVDEENYLIFVAVAPGKSMRAYATAANTKNRFACKPVTISRSRFPNGLFEA